ncbi:hypothetical protein KJ854_05640 [Patescibacteria group bacterium]|nr:hypothetical protein [Patescibacteria group bacterium]
MKKKLAMFVVATLFFALIATVAVVSAKESPDLIVREFIGAPYPQVADITDDPMRAGIKVIRDNERIILENKNSRFILVVVDTDAKYLSEAVLIAPNQTRELYAPNAKVMTIAYPRQEYIRGGPKDYYFKFD